MKGVFCRWKGGSNLGYPFLPIECPRGPGGSSDKRHVGTTLAQSCSPIQTSEYLQSGRRLDRELMMIVQ